MFLGNFFQLYNLKFCQFKDFKQNLINFQVIYYFMCFLNHTNFFLRENLSNLLELT